MYVYGNKHIEHTLYPISESGYEPDERWGRGMFKATDILIKYDADGCPAYRRETVRNFYFDTEGNVYKTKTSQQILFNLLK